MIKSLYLAFFLSLCIVSILSFTEEGSAIGNDTTNASVSVESFTVRTMPIDLHGIWRVFVADKEIIMAVNQSGDALFGLCKSESENPSNGVIAGFVLGQEADVSMAFAEEKLLAAIQIDGIVNGYTMSGKYIRSDEKGNASKGNFTAMKISSDVSGYTPAKVATEVLPNPKPQAVQPATKKPLFSDVRNLASRINPNIKPPHAPV